MWARIVSSTEESGGVHLESVPHLRTSAAKKLLGRARLALILTVLLIELAILFLGTSAPIDAATQQALQNEAKNLPGVSNSSSPVGLFVYIFAHNTAVALGEMVPVFGGLLWVASIYETGQIIQAVALSQGASGALYGLIVMLLPFAIVELAAYAVAVSSGLLVVVAWKRHQLRRETGVLTLEVGAVASMLFTAAAMETATIMDPIFGIDLWVPTAFAIVALALISGRLSR